MPEELIVVGYVVKPHGIRGEVVVEALSDVPGRFDAGVTVRVGTVDRTISASRAHQGRVLVAFDGIADRSDAETLRGVDVRAPAADVSESETYYAHELVGMDVVDVAGATLGAVAALIEVPAAAAYDLLEVERDDGTIWLLPAVDEYVDVEPAPDGGERLRVTDPPEGLVPGDAHEAP